MPNARTKEAAGANEKEDIALLVAAIHAKTPTGIKVAAAFQTKFGVPILDARARAGNRSNHYDFEILVGPAPGTWKKVEHKGSQKYTPIHPDDTPWAAGVQFHNGGCELYSMARAYARLWYDTHIGSGALKTEWNITAPIPSFDEWFTADAKVQGDPKTAFGKELKQKVRDARGPKSSLLEKRAPVLAAFNPTEADFEQLKKEALTVLNAALREKDYWLTIHGDLRGEFHCAWYPPFQLGAIDSVTMDKKKDIFFNFKSAETSFCAILRFGKGAGFSNIRLDAK